MRRALLLLLILLPLTGCLLGELLNPDPPPPEEKCYATLTIRMISNGTDTTYHHQRIEVACEEEGP